MHTTHTYFVCGGNKKFDIINVRCTGGQLLVAAKVVYVYITMYDITFIIPSAQQL